MKEATHTHPHSPSLSHTLLLSLSGTHSLFRSLSLSLRKQTAPFAFGLSQTPFGEMGQTGLKEDAQATPTGVIYHQVYLCTKLYGAHRGCFTEERFFAFEIIRTKKDARHNYNPLEIVSAEGKHFLV